MKHVVSYAQNREDIILSGFFDLTKKGFYVDVGADDPDSMSVTKLFYDAGWSGMNIEPIKKQHKRFVDKRPRDLNFNCGVSNKPGILRFREYEGSGLSTFSQEMKEQYTGQPHKLTEDATKRHADYDVEVRTLAQIFGEHTISHIDFLKVDVEGFEYEVLEGNDWKKYRPQVICIEANHVVKDWRKLLRENKYTLTFFDGLNEYYVDTLNPPTKKFSYVETVVYQEPIVHYSLLDEFKNYENTLASLRVTKKSLEEECELLREEAESIKAEVQTLRQALDEITPLRRHFKRQVKARLRHLDQKVTKQLESAEEYTPLKVIENPRDTKGLKQFDKQNLSNFNKAKKGNFLLGRYISVKKFGLKALEKVIKG